mgnify:CR=1 FL=1
MMLSMPEEWNYSTRGLAAICKEGVEAVGNALKELEKAGYMVRRQLRGENGRITDTEYIIYEKPQEPSAPERDSIVPRPFYPVYSHFHHSDLKILFSVVRVLRILFGKAFLQALHRPILLELSQGTGPELRPCPIVHIQQPRPELRVVVPKLLPGAGYPRNHPAASPRL